MVSISRREERSGGFGTSSGKSTVLSRYRWTIGQLEQLDARINQTMFCQLRPSGYNHVGNNATTMTRDGLAPEGPDMIENGGKAQPNGESVRHPKGWAEGIGVPRNAV